MSALRASLNSLDDGALEAAASKGLLRRAHRDHEAGLASIAAEEEGEAHLAVDGESVVLVTGGLAAARCSCPARGACRHILAAVIALRAPGNSAGEQATVDPEAAAATPAGDSADPVAELLAFSPAELVKAFGRPTLRDAEAILAAAGEAGEAVAVAVQARTCVLRLPGQPEVRYIAGLGLASMISKEPAPLPAKRQIERKAKRKPLAAEALHAAAVLALRRQASGEQTGDRAAPDPSDAAAAAARPADLGPFLDAVAAALAQAARSALATAPLLVEERLLDLALSSRADALPRLAAQLRGIAADMALRRDRGPSFEPAAALALIARTFALVTALRGSPDDPILRGALRRPVEALPPLDLVGCGLEVWQTPTGARGVSAHLLAVGGTGVLPYTLTLARAAGQDPFFQPLQAAKVEPVWGSSLEALAAGGSLLQHAEATADRRLSLGRETRRQPTKTTLATLAATRPELFIADWAEIPARLAAEFSPALRGEARPIPLILAPTAVEAPQFDALSQRASLPIRDRQGCWLEMALDGRRVDAATAMQARGLPDAMTVLARCEDAEIVLEPIAALHDGALASFDLYEAPPQPVSKQGALDRLKQGLGALVGAGRPARFAPVGRTDAASHALIARAGDEALALAELGGRMEDRERFERLGAIADGLDAAALEPLATLLRRLVEASPRQRPLRLLAFAHGCSCHAALAPRIPLLHRLA